MSSSSWNATLQWSQNTDSLSPFLPVLHLNGWHCHLATCEHLSQCSYDKSYHSWKSSLLWTSRLAVANIHKVLRKFSLGLTAAHSLDLVSNRNLSGTNKNLRWLWDPCSFLCSYSDKPPARVTFHHLLTPFDIFGFKNLNRLVGPLLLPRDWKLVHDTDCETEALATVHPAPSKLPFKLAFNQ